MVFRIVASQGVCSLFCAVSRGSGSVLGVCKFSSVLSKEVLVY